MRILYGVSGEGFGHSSRAKVMINHLQSLGHEVMVMTYAQAYEVLKKDFRVCKIGGIVPKYKEGRLSLWQSIVHNLPIARKTLRDYWKLSKIIDEFNPELCITDMEPIVPISSFKRCLPLISIDNQHAMTNLKLDAPKKYKRAYYLAKTVVNRCVSKADAFIVLSFYKAKAKVKNTFVVNPILREEILKAKPKYGKKILVYLSKEDNKLIKILKQIPEEFVVYGYEKFYRKNNLEFKKSGDSFLKDLINAKAVIASAGFSLISETLYLKKPYFAMPLAGQFEQYENAVFLKKTNFGTFSEKPTKKEIENFLDDLNKYKKKLGKNKFDPREAEKVLEKIVRKMQKNIEKKNKEELQKFNTRRKKFRVLRV